ncbi:MAG: tRNA pseudouridine synthase A [Sumerlaeia bacterium]
MSNATSRIVPPQECRKIAAIVEYDGTRYSGSQIQDNSNTVQGEIKKMSQVFGVEDYQYYASGRTDSGVHARGQVIVMCMPKSLHGERLLEAMNWHLPTDIRIRKAVECSEDFNPRFDARLRTYRYLLCGGQPLPPLMANRMGSVKRHLDFKLMQQATEVLLSQEWDFKAWRSSICKAKRTKMNLTTLRVDPWSDRALHGGDSGCYEITISARFFLHHMVRYLVGGLARVGHGALSVKQLQQDLQNGVLPHRVAPADACGLCLEHVYYPPEKDPFFNGQ